MSGSSNIMDRPPVRYRYVPGTVPGTGTTGLLRVTGWQRARERAIFTHGRQWRRMLRKDPPARVLSPIEYAKLVKTPEQVEQSGVRFVLNAMNAQHNGEPHGHVAMAMNFTSMLGFAELNQGGLEAARQLQRKGVPFAYMTLTNDHQVLTERGHDHTLAWERSVFSRSADAVFIGPPSKFIYEGPRKALFCQLSEGLVNRTGDQWQRFTPPCVTQDRAGGNQNGDEYAGLIRAAPSVVKGLGYEHHNGTPRWLTRKVATKAVAAAGQFMYPLSHAKALKSDFASLHRHGPLLLRYLDPPLMQRGTHLGVPVKTRVEVRIFGLVQWEPLRIWTSRYGFFRGGSPWFNYSSAVDFTDKNGAMWNINRGVEARCEASLPAKHPPWRDASWYEQCKARHRTTSKAGKCCVCLTVADVFDIEHDEKGFATSGTLRKLDHVASDAGLEPRRVWQSVDEALIREFIAEQRYYQKQAAGSPLSRWATIFSADVGFTADGRAYLYENLLMPNWKRPGYFWHEAVDRASAVGIYSSQALAMSKLLVHDEIDAIHRRIIGSLQVDAATEHDVLEFLRTQGLASVMGYRRTWPSPQRSAAHSSDGLADARDLSFARLLREYSLLMPGMDVLSIETPKVDLWGGHSPRGSASMVPRWPMGNGVLFGKPSGKGRGDVCIDTPDILAAYDEQAAARTSNPTAE